MQNPQLKNLLFNPQKFNFQNTIVGCQNSTDAGANHASLLFKMHKAYALAPNAIPDSSIFNISHKKTRQHMRQNATVYCFHPKPF